MQTELNKNISNSIEDSIYRINEIDENLKLLMGNSEEDFLNAGKKLYSISELAMSVSQSAQSCSEIFVGENSQKIFGNLKSKFRNLESYFNFSLERVEGDKDFLSLVVEDFDKINDPFFVFKKIIKRLNFLSIAVRIESARLSSENKIFEVLAQDITALASNAEVNLQEIDVLIQAINKKVAELFQEIGELRSRKYEDSKNTIAPVIKVIDKFWEEQRKYAELNTANSQVMEENSSNIDEIVVSLQAHDFARQKLEHITEIINDQILNNNDSKDVEFANRIMVVLEMQKAQLVHANDSIQSSIGNVNNKLQSIYDNSKIIENDTDNIVSSWTSADKDMLSDTSNKINEITSSLVSTTKVHEKISSEIRSIMDLVNEMIDAIKKIDQLDETIKLLAVNGLIHAAKLGNEGNALRVIADSVQQLSNESQMQVGSFEQILNAIIDHSAKIKISQSENDDTSDFLIDTISKELNKFFGEIISLHSSLKIKSADFHKTTTEFNNSLFDVINNIRVGEYFNKLTNETLDKIDAIIADLYQFGDEEKSGIIRKELDKVYAKYTMDSEREIHESVLTGSKVEVKNDLENDDSNVELF